MITEYGQGVGTYGDFGRYVFESALSNFNFQENIQLISNYATKKIFEEYGYDGEFFYKVEKILSDMNRYNYNKYNHKVERIGKKYQWIATHDTLARVTDNFKMYDASSWGKDKKELQYEGTFEPYVRDIDPTILLKNTKVINYDRTEENFFWNPKFNFEWSMDNKLWVENTIDLPNPNENIEFIDENSQSWIALTSFPEWREPSKKGYDKYKTVHKKLWYQVRSYLIPKKDLTLLTEWAKRQWFWNNWMPSEQGHYQMFNREHYWSEAYNFFQNPYYGRYEEWTTIERDLGKESYLNKIALTTDKYYWESGFDYSKEDSLSMLKPSRIIFEGLEMQYSQRDGEYIDKENNIICFEASVYNESHQCLLVQKDKLLKFLDDNDLTIFWTNIGEKQIFTPNHNREDFLGLMEVSGFSYLVDGEITHGDMKVMYMDEKREKHSRKVDTNE